ncbi:MAG: hypothetical protein ACYDCK_07635, partial [Thermoplasmatota archaeon]
IAQKHDMLLPPDFMLITRAVFQFEGLCKKLDPEYELVEVLEPYVLALLRKEMFSVSRQKEAVLDAAFSGADLLRNLPHRMNNIIRKIEASEFRVKVDVADLAQHSKREERRTLRSTFTLLVAALTVGTAVVMAFGNAVLLLPFLFAAGLFILLWAFAMLYWSD